MPFALPTSPILRIAAIVVLAVLAHVLVRGLRWLGEWALTPQGTDRTTLSRRYPKVATVGTILVSAVTFTIYFGGFGLVLRELGVPLENYLVSASVIGLAVGFGSQGLVQDIVIGLTIIFSDVLNVGDVVDIGGQSGRVERIGLRFTTLVNLLDQKVYVPNRNIGQINRYRNGYIRAYADIQVPEGLDEDTLMALVTPLADGMHAQYGAIVLTPPEVMGLHRADPGGWRYLRLKFRLWPGQGVLIETTFRQRALAALRTHTADYADWMITITYRVDD